MFQTQINDSVAGTGLGEGGSGGLRGFAVLLAGEPGAGSQADQQQAGRCGIRRKRQHQRVAELRGKIAAGVQFCDHSVELLVDLAGCDAKVAVLIDADHRATGRVARFGINNGLEFHIVSSVLI